MTLQQLLDRIKAVVDAGYYRWLDRNDHPALDSLPPGLWLHPAARDPADLIHWVPPWPAHPLEVVASPGCYGVVTDTPTRDQCMALMTARGRFATAMNMWGKALGVSPRLASIWFMAFTPLGVPLTNPRGRVMNRLRHRVWEGLGFTADDALLASYEAATAHDPPVRRPTFWEPQHVEYPADLDRVYLDRVVPVDPPEPHDS